MGSRSHREVWPGLMVLCLGEGTDELGTAGIVTAVDATLWGLDFIWKAMGAPGGFKEDRIMTRLEMDEHSGSRVEVRQWVSGETQGVMG